MAYIPTLNAGLTLYIIQPYREFFLELCGRQVKQPSNISNTTRTDNASSTHQVDSDVKTEQ
jgi:hypothetical protein